MQRFDLLHRRRKPSRAPRSNRRRDSTCGFSFNRMENLFALPLMPTNSLGATMATLSDLTARELEILQLVLAGYTNKAIAGEMFISEKTVEFHLDNIYTKTGVRSRVLAGIWALQQGILAETREIPS